MRVATKKITIRDVAREAGVSVTTVSGVLNGINEFSANTVKKVWETAHSLNYVPNQQARKLRQDERERLKTNIIMRINYAGNYSQEVIFRDQRIAMFDYLAQEKGFFGTNYSYDSNAGFRCPLLLDNLVDGVVLGLPHREVINVVREKLPAVLMDVGVSSDEVGIPVVRMDTLEGISRVLRKIREKEPERIFGFLHSDCDGSILRNEDIFLKHFKQAAAEYGFRETKVDLSFPFTPETHRQVMLEASERIYRMIVKNEISAIGLTNTSYLAMLHQYLTDKGVRLPEDFLIIPIDHSGDATVPGCLTVSYDWVKLIGTSIEVLKKLIDREKVVCMDYLIQAQITEMDY